MPKKSVAKKSSPETRGHGRRGVLIKLEPEVRSELEMLSVTRKRSIQELAAEAIADLLKKHGRPSGLLDALKKSAKRR